MKPRLPVNEAREETTSRPWALQSLLPLAAAAVLFALGISGLAGVLPFVESSFSPSATPVPGALGRNPQPLPTQFVARDAPGLPDLEPVFDLLRPAYVLPAAPATLEPEAQVLSAGSGSVRAVQVVAPTPTPTSEPTATATATPTNTPEPTATPTPEPAATPTAEGPVPPKPAAGTWNPTKPEVALFDPNPPAETSQADGDFGGYSTLPPPQE